MSKSKKTKILDEPKNIRPCINCNPKKYLTFNFSYITYENPKTPLSEDVVNFFERMRSLSNDTFYNNMYKYQGNKANWFENININQVMGYIDNDKSEQIALRHGLAMRTYFRKLAQAEEQCAGKMSQMGFTSERLTKYLAAEKWITEIYQQFSSKEDKGEIIEEERD